MSTQPASLIRLNQAVAEFLPRTRHPPDPHVQRSTGRGRHSPPRRSPASCAECASARSARGSFASEPPRSRSLPSSRSPASQTSPRTQETVGLQKRAAQLATYTRLSELGKSGKLDNVSVAKFHRNQQRKLPPPFLKQHFPPRSDCLPQGRSFLSGQERLDCLQYPASESRLSLSLSPEILQRASESSISVFVHFPSMCVEHNWSFCSSSSFPHSTGSTKQHIKVKGQTHSLLGRNLKRKLLT